MGRSRSRASAAGAAATAPKEDGAHVARRLPARESEGIANLLFVALLVALNLAVFSQVKNHQFVSWDDDLYVTANRLVLQGLSFDGVKLAFSTFQAFNWHPLTILSHMADVTFFGPGPGPAHLVNLFWHTTNAVLLYVFLVQVLGDRLASFLTAALFAIHPLHVESVAWVSERKDLLSTFFLLLALQAYRAYATRGTWAPYAATFLCLALGLLSKPMLVTAPFLLLLLDYWPFGRLAPFLRGNSGPLESLRRLSTSRPLWEKLPFLLLSVGSSALTLAAQTAGEGVKGWGVYPLSFRLGNAAVSYVWYLGRSLWPARLSFFYPLLGVSHAAWQVAGAAATLFVLTWAALRWGRTRPFLVVGWFWYLVSLVPVIGVIQVGDQSRADRYSYLPLIGIFLVAAWGLSSWARSPVRRWALPLVAVLLSVLALRSWDQTRVWRDSASLYRHALEVSEDNWMAHYNLANELRTAGRGKEAERHYRQTLRLYPGYGKASQNLALVLLDDGRVGEAIHFFEDALSERGQDPSLRFALANALRGVGRLDEAIHHLTAAVALRPSFAEAHLLLGSVLEQRGDDAGAVEHYRQSLALDPRNRLAAWLLRNALSRRTR